MLIYKNGKKADFSDSDTVVRTHGISDGIVTIYKKSILDGWKGADEVIIDINILREVIKNYDRLNKKNKGV